jgi:peptidoglycan/LPS O-acetylase OafA/YrhL
LTSFWDCGHAAESRSAACSAHRALSYLTLYITIFDRRLFCLALRGYFGMGFFNVDLFFCLSGFVLTHAYKRRVYEGLSSKSFLVERMVRLYPTYVVGLLIGIVAAIITYNPADQASIFTQSALAIFLVPDLASKELFPLNNPAWSLFFDIVVNILFFYLIFTKTWTNKAIILVSAILYVAAVAHFKGAAGWGP